MGKYCTASVKLEQAYNIYRMYMYVQYIYIYTVTTEGFLQVWGSLRLTPIIGSFLSSLSGCDLYATITIYYWMFLVITFWMELVCHNIGWKLYAIIASNIGLKLVNVSVYKFVVKVKGFIIHKIYKDNFPRSIFPRLFIFVIPKHET